MKKIIVEMSEQEYKKCKQIINEISGGMQETNPKIIKLQQELHQIDDEIRKITHKYASSKQSSFSYDGETVNFDIGDLFVGKRDKDMSQYIDNLIVDLQKLPELYEKRNTIKKEITKLRNPNMDKEETLGEKFINGVKNILKRANTNITVETNEDSKCWFRLNAPNKDKKAWDILTYIMNKIGETEMSKIQANYRNCFNLRYANNLDEETVNKYIKMFSIIINQAVTEYKNT